MNTPNNHNSKQATHTATAQQAVTKQPRAPQGAGHIEDDVMSKYQQFKEWMIENGASPEILGE
jgi:hypothetical protein